MSWRILPSFIILFGGIILGTVISGLILNFVIDRFDKTKTPASVKTLIFPILAFAVMGTCTILLFTALANPLPIDALTTPRLGKEFEVLKLTDKSFITDAYRDEINAAVKNKLGDYTVPDYATDNPQESILYGGDSLKSVATTKDSKTYTLKPDWNYDHSTHTVKLSVTVKEGYHPGEM